MRLVRWCARAAADSLGCMREASRPDRKPYRTTDARARRDGVLGVLTRLGLYVQRAALRMDAATETAVGHQNELQAAAISA